MYRFPWYLTLVSANHASSNPGQISNWKVIFIIKKIYKFIMKNMTDFRKAVETGVDLCLACRHLLFSLLDPLKTCNKGNSRHLYAGYKKVKITS